MLSSSSAPKNSDKQVTRNLHIIKIRKSLSWVKKEIITEKNILNNKILQYQIFLDTAKTSIKRKFINIQALENKKTENQ